MSLAELVDSGWAVHATDTEALAGRLEGGIGLVASAEDAARLVHLGNHAVGQHLGDWPRARRLADAALARVAAPTPGLLVHVAVARHVAGDAGAGRAAEAAAVAIAPAEAAAVPVRVRLLVAEALFGTGRREEAIRLHAAAAAEAEALPEAPAAWRAAAVVSNNLASGLLEVAGRTPAEDEAMLRAAATARRTWLKVGDWTHDERSDYLLALVSNALGRFGDGVLHAARGLVTIEKGGEEPVDEAFLSLALSRAYRGLGLGLDADRALADADRLAAAFPDEGLRSWYATERDRPSP